jgi:2-oxoisovalerate dehydrogenase E1 component
MPRSHTIHPQDVRRRDLIEFEPIPVNRYDRALKDEIERFAPGELLRIHRDMALIRAFETLLEEIKRSGSYRGVAYTHRGPAHLSIGQEAAAVGQAYHLGVDDPIYGSHRSHGEILAKGLSAIEKLDDATLLRILETYQNGAILKAVEKPVPIHHAALPLPTRQAASLSVKSLAVEFLLYGAFAEIFARETGFNRGMGGSMHAFFPPFGIYPNNALVGGSAPIAVGAALYKRVNREPGMVICNIGDASASCGPVWEALCFATMDQFRTLFDAAHRGGLPLIVNFVNNFYGMGGQPVGETGGFGILARLGAGLNPEQMHAERIDGYNPLAVIDAVARKREILARSEGPVLLDTVTYRYSGHSPSDASSYRDKSEVNAWQQVDSLLTYGQDLLAAGLCRREDLDREQEQVEAAVLRAFLRAIDPTLSPRADLRHPGCLLERTMYSNGHVESLDPERTPETLLPRAENPRVKRLAARSRSGIGPDGGLLPKAGCIGIRDALFEAILDRFHADPTLIAYGEENRDWGGAFGVYQGLIESLPYHRLFNSPIAEAAIVGTAVGYALAGGRALVELMYCDFLGRAGDEVFNQLAKWQSMSGGLLRMPVVLRVSVGSKYGAQHSQDWSALCAHIPGLKVVFPATPYDAKGLLNAALTGTDPVVFFESQRLYDQPELFHGVEGVPEGYYEVTFGLPEVRRSGSDLTLLTVGATLYRALETADILQSRYGLSAEVIDARSLVPFDYAPVIESVRKTGRILLASDACERGSYLQTLAASITRFAFKDLDAPPIVVGARNWITSPDELEESFFPFPSDLLDAIHQHILPLPGYTVQRRCDEEELLRRSREGV